MRTEATKSQQKVNPVVEQGKDHLSLAVPSEACDKDCPRKRQHSIQHDCVFERPEKYVEPARKVRCRRAYGLCT